MNKRVVLLIPSIILYIVAGLVAVFAIWAYSHCADIISQARAAGQLVTSGNEYDIASFYMANSGQYFIYALLLAAAGLLLQRKQCLPIAPVPSTESSSEKRNDEELDDWFNEMDSAEQSEVKGE